MRLASIARFILIAAAVGAVAPFLLSLCLFGTTLQSFVQGPLPTQGWWSGAPTAVPTPVPSAIQAASWTAFSSAGGAVFVLWSVIGAMAGEAYAVRRWRDDWHVTRKAILGAAAGSALFMLIAVCGGLMR